ncbi:MAG TPA: lipid II flippase MurJ [Armatimonadota bacterium]|nr:lipid II flippase MurJ [Armatimonadota bacterium]
MAVQTDNVPTTGDTATKLGRSAVLITAFTAIQIFFQFFMQILLAAKFGAARALDSYFAALTIPIFVSSLFTGVVYVTLVPIITECRANASSTRAIDLGIQFARATFLAVGAFAAIISILSRIVAKLLVPGFDSESLRLTAELLRINATSTVFSGTSIVLACIYYSRRQFFLPVFAPVAGGVITLAAIVLYSNRLGIYAAAWGMLAGSVAGLILLIPALLRAGARFFTFSFDHPGLKTGLRLMAPLLIASVLVRTTLITDRIFASYLGEGTISHISFASRITTVVIALSVQGISVSIFPLLSNAAAKGDMAGLSRLLHLSLRWSIIATGLVMATVLALGCEVVNLLLKHGEVLPSDSMAISALLVLYTGMLAAHIIGNGVVSTLYSLRASRLVALISGVGAALYVPAVAILASLFGAKGIAAASSILALSNLSWFVVFLHRRWVRLHWSQIAHYLACTAVAALAAAAIEMLIHGTWAKTDADILQRATQLMVTFAAGLVIYWVCLAAMRLEEARWLWQRSVRQLVKGKSA